MARRGQRVLVIAVGCALAVVTTGCRDRDGAPPSSTPRIPASASPTTDTAARPRAACTGADLLAGIGEYGSTMSQPFLTVTLTNTRRMACRLHGYPALTITGTEQGTPIGPRDIVVRHGPTYERPDPGPTWLTLRPREVASFTLGTAVAYGERDGSITLSRMVIPLKPGDHPLSIAMTMAASAPPGKRIPVAETALRLGVYHF